MNTERQKKQNSENNFEKNGIRLEKSEYSILRLILWLQLSKQCGPGRRIDT